MSVPTITQVSPSPIFTGGQLVTLTGTGFQTPYPPPNSTGILPAPNPTVEVTIGGVKAKKVVVRSSTELTCVAPSQFPGSYDVTVQNLDSDGEPIPGELVTGSSLATYERADLTAESDFNRLERALLLELQKQIIENVVKTVAVDYDSETGGAIDVVDTAKLPIITVSGPQVNEAYFWDLDRGTQTVTGTTFTRRRTFKTVHLRYRIAGMDDHTVRSTNLHALVLQFLNNNTYIELPRDPNDESKGSVQYELIQVGDFATFAGSSESDVRGFSGQFEVRGFQLEDVAGFADQTVAERGSTVDNVAVQPISVFEPE